MKTASAILKAKPITVYISNIFDHSPKL